MSAVFAALVSILSKVGMKGVDSNLATAIRTVVILVFAWGITLADGSVQSIGKLSSTNWIFLILSGAATGLSWLFYFRALDLTEATKVVPIDRLSLVLAVIMAVVFLHEKLTWTTAIGSTLITVGVLVIALWH
jgi:transporter family protein